MANNYYMDLVVRGSKKSLDEMQGILQQEIDEGQTNADYYTVHRSLERMGFDPEKIECRAYMEGLNPFCELDEWVGDEALPVINRYYGTDCQSMEQAFESIERLCHSDRMQFCEEC